MPDETDRLLRDAPARFPAPPPAPIPEPDRRPPRRMAGFSTVAVLAAALVGIGVGHWIVPPDEPAIGAPTAEAITIDAQPRVLQPGHSVALSGSIVVRQQGEELQLEQLPCGSSSWRYMKSVITDDRGVWSDFAMPAQRTSYRAVWRGARSPAVSVVVRPFVILRLGSGRRTLSVRIPSAGASLAGHTATFQRLVNHRWQTFRTVPLAEAQTPYGRSFEAEIRYALPRGASVRAALLLAQARPCYVGAFSNVIKL